MATPYTYHNMAQNQGRTGPERCVVRPVPVPPSGLIRRAPETFARGGTAFTNAFYRRIAPPGGVSVGEELSEENLAEPLIHHPEVVPVFEVGRVPLDETWSVCDEWA